jgi:hypothetical protein
MKVLVSSQDVRQALTMAAKDQPSREVMVAEAASNQTSSERLAELAKSDDPFVQLAALKNPNTSNDAFFDALFG